MIDTSGTTDFSRTDYGIGARLSFDGVTPVYVVEHLVGTTVDASFTYTLNVGLCGSAGYRSGDQCWYSGTEQISTYSHPATNTAWTIRARPPSGAAFVSHSVTVSPAKFRPAVGVEGGNGNGQTGPINHTLTKPLISEVVDFTDTVVEYPVSGGVPVVTATFPMVPNQASGQSVTQGIRPSTFLFSHSLRLGNKVGSYQVLLNNADTTGASSPWTFLANAVAEAPGDQNDPEKPNSGPAEGETEGDPISIANGNNYHVETDYPRVGVSPIEFKRAFNSRSGLSRLMGNYWTTTYDRFVIPPAGTGQPAQVQRPTGRRLQFNQSSGQFVGAPHELGRLEAVAPGWRYTDVDGTVETFDGTGKLLAITDIRGRTQTASYDASGRLNRITANTGEFLTFEYNAQSRISALVDHTTRRWTYTYDGYVNLTQVLGPDGVYRTHHHEASVPWMVTGVSVGRTQFPTSSHRAITWTYDSERRATSSNGHASAVALEAVTIEYRPDGTRLATLSDGTSRLYTTTTVNGRTWVTAVSGAAGQAGGPMDVVRSHDSAMNVTAISRHGRTTTFEGYDAKRQPRFVIRAPQTANERRVEYEYDPRFINKPIVIREPSVAPGQTKVTSITYNGRGSPTAVVVNGFRPDGVSVSRTWQYEYNGPFGQLTQANGPRNDVTDVTRIEYNAANNRAQRVIDANGIVVRDAITYTPTGRIKTEARPNAVSVVYEYFAGSELLKSIRVTKGSLAQTTAWTYDDRNRVASISYSNGVNTTISTSFEYDAMGKVRRVSSPNGMAIDFTIDAKGNVDYERVQQGSTTRRWIDRTFDAYNQIDKLIGANGTVDYNFGPDGTLARVTDAENNSTNYSYDDFKRLTRVMEPESVETRFGYDVHGRLTEVVDPINATTRYEYDDLGNRLRIVSPDTGETRFVYDNAGNVASTIDSLNRTTAYAYDAGSRLRSVNRDGSDYDESYSYDACLNGVGRLCSISNGIAENVSFEYDGFGRVSKQTTSAGSLGFTYDAAGNVVRLTYPSGRAVFYDYDSAGLVSRVRVEEGGGTHPIATNIVHEPFGPAKSWTFGNGLTNAHTFDEQYWLRGIQAGAALQINHGVIDRAGNIKNRTMNSAAYQYAYDQRSRLDTASGPFGTRDYDLDANGNRTFATSNGVSTSLTYEPGSNRIDTAGDWNYTLDAVGNTIEKRKLDGSAVGHSYHYSPHNRLVEVRDLASALTLGTYRYNPLGQRASKMAAGATTRFVYGTGAQLLSELDSVGVLQEYVYLEGRLIALLGRPQAVPPPPTFDATVDNRAANDPIWVGGTWTTKSDNKAYNGQYLHGEMATSEFQLQHGWGFTLPTPGTYDHYVWFISRETSSNTVYTAPGSQFTLAHAGKVRGTWVKIGSAYHAAGSVVVQIDAQLSKAAGATTLDADAARLVLTEPGTSSASHHRYVHTDHLGAPVAVTGGAGQVEWRAVLDPFGSASISSDVDGNGQHVTLNIRLPGQYLDAESSLHYNYLRTYDGTIGRYLESDPVGLAGGLNTFAYAGANPVTFSDRFGLAFEPHDYELGRTWLCDQGSSDCNFADLIELLDDQSVPFVFDPKEGRIIISVLPFDLWNDPIFHIVDRENGRIYNITDEGHTFHPGEVVHIIEEGSRTQFDLLNWERNRIETFELVTIGTGTGPYGLLNELVGPVLFGWTHIKVQSAIQQRIRGR